MSKPYFSHAMTSHKSALVNICVDTIYASFCSILPKSIISSVCKFGFLIRILGNHKTIIVNFALEMFVVEICICIQ